MLLLTGATGFAGSWLRQQTACAVLERNGAPIDLTAREAVMEAVAAIRPSQVIHLAARSFIPESFADPLLTFRVNFLATYNLLEALKRCGFCGRFLYVGSADEYGAVDPERLPIREDCPLKPLSPYGVSKVAAETLCMQWGLTERFEVIMARPFPHIGPGQSPRFVVSSLARQIAAIRKRRQPPVITVGDVNTTRDFTDVRDVIRAYRLLLARGRNGEAYNICSGVGVTIRSVLERLLDLAGVQAEIRTDPARYRPSEARAMVGSCAKLRAETGWTPQVSFDDTLTGMLRDWELHTP